MWFEVKSQGRVNLHTGMPHSALVVAISVLLETWALPVLGQGCKKCSSAGGILTFGDMVQIPCSNKQLVESEMREELELSIPPSLSPSLFPSFYSASSPDGGTSFFPNFTIHFLMKCPLSRSLQCDVKEVSVHITMLWLVMSFCCCCFVSSSMLDLIY